MLNRLSNLVSMRRLALSLYFILLVTLIVGVVILESTLKKTREREEQLHISHHLTIIGTKLQGIVTNNLSLISGLAAHISSNPEMTQDEFDRYVQAVFRQEPLLINMAAAPDMVVRFVYPLERNKKAIGLDYREVPDQWEAAKRARDSAEMVIAGPLELVQGGKALIGRKAVFTSEGTFWGLVAAPIDIEALYQQAGLKDLNNHLRLAIRGRDGLGEAGDVFFGDASLFDDPQAVRLTLQVAAGSWQLAAVPVDGWSVTPPLVWWLRGGFAAIFLLMHGAFFLWPKHNRSEARYQRILHKQAVYDQLTGLPNRFLHGMDAVF